MQKKIVLPIFLHSSDGGMQKVVYNIIDGLASKGWNLVLILSKDSELIPFLGQIKGTMVHELNYCLSLRKPILSLKFLFSLFILVFKYKKSLFISNDTFTHILLSLYPFARRELFISHGGDYKSKDKEHGYNSGITNKIVKYTFRRVSIFVAVSDSQKCFLINNAKVKKNVNIIYNSYRLLHEIPVIKKDSFVHLAIIGYIRPLKNQKTAILALDILRNSGYNCILDLFGSIYDQAYYEDLLQLIRSLELNSYVVFHGFTRNENTLWESTDILLSTSFHEGFGLTIIEAMAHKIPVIAYSQASGPSSLIKNKETGLLVRENTAQDYANAVKLYIDNEIFKNEIIDKAYDKYEKEFSYEIMINKYDKILTEWK